MDIFQRHTRAVTLVFMTFFLYVTSQDIASSSTIFEEKGGFLIVEAEGFYKQSNTDVRRWYIMNQKPAITVTGRDDDPMHVTSSSGNAYIEVLPDTRTNHEDKLIKGENFSDQPGKLAIVHYKIKIKNPGRYYVWVRAFSTGTEDNGIHVGIDGKWPASGQRMQWCEGKNSWHWESRQRTKEAHCGVPKQIYLDIEQSGLHDIQFSMREDGFEMDRWLLTDAIDFNPATMIGGTDTKNNVTPSIKGELKKWHKITLAFKGPETSETDVYNPFFNYKLNVEFSHALSGKHYVIPGYFAADGNAGETSATRGNIWKAHFAPDETGRWTYRVIFRKGKWAAVSDLENTGVPGGFMHGTSGYFNIENTDKTGDDLRGKGRLQYVGERYLKFAETGDYFLKAGPDAPENFMAYTDFDGTFQDDGHKDHLIKTWEAHLRDWKEGDPVWKASKGKAIIGALNYIASKGLNSVSFLTNTIAGDDQNVFPYINYNTYDRFDVSKLDQWEILFEHADKLGLFLHFKTLESENQGLLDHGGVGAITKLYYRELIARFGHHLALNWNICEESGDWQKNPVTPPQSKRQRLAMAQYFYDHDPYHHHVVIHNGISFDDILGSGSRYTGVSLQTNKTDFSNVHHQVLHWINTSKKAGKQWAVATDEPGDAQHALLPDKENPNHDMARKNGLWGTLMAGGWGTEWYFGYKHPHSDLTCQDYRSRDLFWNQAVTALNFFTLHKLPFWAMENRNDLVANPNNKNTIYCFAKTGHYYLIYLNSVSIAMLDLKAIKGEYTVRWFYPKTGEEILKPPIAKVKGGEIVSLGKAPDNNDWLILVEKIN